MGEIAEMMLDGTLCRECGVALVSEGESPPGFPRKCLDCRVGSERAEKIRAKRRRWRANRRARRRAATPPAGSA